MAERNHKGSNAMKTVQSNSKDNNNNNMHRSVSREVQLSQGQRHSSASKEVARTQEKDQVRSTCSNSSSSTTHSNSAVQEAVNNNHKDKIEPRESVSRREIRQSKTKGRPTGSK